MSDPSRHAALALSRAAERLRVGDPAGALEALREGLALAPDHALLHAVLARVLLQLRRRHAAREEAGIAIGLEPTLPAAHLAMGLAHLAFRDLGKAEAALREAVALDPGDDGCHAALGRALLAARRREEAEAAFRQAAALDPSDASHVAAIGEVALARGRRAEARAHARAALELEPESPDALVLMGEVLLADGERAEAREHALSVLRTDATNFEALHLLTAVKAKESLLLGLWWRFNGLLSTFGRGTVLALIGMFVAYRFAVIALQEAGAPGPARVAQLVWLGFAVYTWVAPGLFRRALERELSAVRLSREF